MTAEETDYVVIGAGASGCSFVDAILSSSDDQVMLVDRRHGLGGHWLDAYPFVELHQPSAFYGVPSLPLGADRVQVDGPEAGWYERATGAEVIEYYARVRRHFEASGRVDVATGHRVESDRHARAGDDVVIVESASGTRRTIRARKAVVDATRIAAEVPEGRPAPFDVETGAHVITPSNLPHAVGGSEYCVVGAGKTAMDVVCWLLANGTDPDDISWVRRRDGWFMNRAYAQPFEQSPRMIDYQSRIVEAAVTATRGRDLAEHLEQHDMMMRIDPSVEATVYRGATVSPFEIEQLRSVERVVRAGSVRSVGPGRVVVGDDVIGLASDAVVVDCTAPGLSRTEAHQIFGDGRIDLHFTTVGVAPWGAALVGFVETLDRSVSEKNRLCPPMPRSHTIDGQLDMARIGLAIDGVRREDPDVAAWNALCRLNPGRSIPDHLDDPLAATAMVRMFEHIEAAMENLQRVAPAPG